MWKLYKRFFKYCGKYFPHYKLRIFCFKQAGYRIGKDVYIGEDLIICDELDDRGNVIIGDRVSIAERVTLVTSSNPNLSRIAAVAPIQRGPVIIHNDAWLGTGVIVLPDITIGEGALVGAASLVTKDVPPYTIFAGVPAKTIRELDKTKINLRCTK